MIAQSTKDLGIFSTLHRDCIRKISVRCGGEDSDSFRHGTLNCHTMVRSAIASRTLSVRHHLAQAGHFEVEFLE